VGVVSVCNGQVGVGLIVYVETVEDSLSAFWVLEGTMLGVYLDLLKGFGSRTDYGQEGEGIQKFHI
jgi:hypothetical protein